MIVNEDSRQITNLLIDRQTLGTVLHIIGLKHFGVEFYDWEPETIFMEFQDQFQIEMPEVNMNKVMALGYGCKSNTFYRDWKAFMAITAALNNDDDVFGIAEPPTPAEVAWAVTEMKLNDSTPERFSQKVATYVGRLLEDAGIVTPPPVLSWAKMPEVYKGSSYGADLNQQEALGQERIEVIHEYIQLQSLDLFKQIGKLPWITASDLETLADKID